MEASSRIRKSRPWVWVGAGVALVGALAAAFVLFVLPWLYPEPPRSVTPDFDDPQARETVPVPRVVFKDVTRAAGVRFVHNNGLTDKKLLPETMGSGVAFIDYNNDGHQDLLFVNACDWPGAPARQGCTRTLALYENDGHGHFTDVTRRVGLDVVMFGMGVTVGDFDNDGNPDLFITGVGGNRLFRNVLVGRDPGGKEIHRFEEVTAEAGVQTDRAHRWPGPGEDFFRRTEPLQFSSSATFVDVDGDGWLDLFVCNYVTWSPAGDLARDFDRTGENKRSFGPPTNFRGSTCLLYRNRGRDRRGRWLGFEDVTKTAGVAVVKELEGLSLPVGKSLGVAACDLDGDGYPDILVANDTARNFLFHNRGRNKRGRWLGFREAGEDANVAYVDGNARGGMGIDVGEYRPGRFGAVIGNFNNEPDTFLVLDRRRARQLFFLDRANSEGIAGPSRTLLKFGALLFDYDLDGRLDLLTCNGQLEPEIKNLDPSQDYAQPVQLFWNTGRPESTFEPVTEKEAGPDLFKPLVGRGCAYGDIDGDGRPDLVLVENGGPARLLHNEGGSGNHRLRLTLRGDGRRSNTSAIGARVTVTAGGHSLTRDVAGARGYLSQSELPLTFGLGKATRVDRVEVRWPGVSGGTQVLTGLDADTAYTVEQGKKVTKGRPLRNR